MSDDIGLGHSQSAPLLDCDGISLDLSRAVDIVEAPVPEAPPLRELSKMSEFVKQIEVKVARAATTVVMLCQNDGRGVVIDPDVAVLLFNPHTGRLQQSGNRHGRGLNAVDSRAFRYERKQSKKGVLPAGQVSDDASVFRQSNHLIALSPDRSPARASIFR